MPTANSKHRGRTCHGCRTLRTWPHYGVSHAPHGCPASSKWRSCLMRWSRLSTIANLSPAAVSFTTQTAVCNTSRSNTPNTWPKPASYPRSPGQPHDFHVTPSLSFKPAARLHMVEIVVDVELQENGRMLRRSACGLGAAMTYLSHQPSRSDGQSIKLIPALSGTEP